MDIAIIVAMDKELRFLMEEMPDNREITVEGHTFHQGHIGDHNVVLSKCGIGKVNSALNTYLAIRTFNPDLVINSGVAGGADLSAPIGTVMAADAVGYHDVWCGPGTVYGQEDGCPPLFEPYPAGMEAIESLKQEFEGLQTGMVASGDIFISKPEEIRRIKELYPQAKACDMESASIAQTCYANGVPFMIVRVVSDMPGSGDNLSQYQNFWSEAPAKTFNIVSALLEKLK